VFSSVEHLQELGALVPLGPPRPVTANEGGSKDNGFGLVNAEAKIKVSGVA